MPNRAVINARIITDDSKIFGSLIYNEQGIILNVIPIDTQGKSIEAEELKSVYQVQEIIDAQNAYAVPGGIDPHVHFGGFGEIPIADDFADGSKAAIAGGTTTVIDFCEPSPGERSVDCIKKRKADAKDALVDYLFHLVLTEEYEKQLLEMEEIKEQGIHAYKLFTIYENTTLAVDQIADLIQKISAKDHQASFLIHAEDAVEIQEKNRSYQGDPSDMTALYETRPDESEIRMVKKISGALKDSDTNIRIAHISAGESVTNVRNSGDENLQFETCPHYLLFTSDKLKGKDGCLYTMTPPLRREQQRQKLWEHVLNGNISMLATDHCPYLKKHKRQKPYNEVPCGVDGVETRMLFLFSEGVHNRGMSMHKFVDLTSKNAAKFYGIYPRKGSLRIGSDADIVLLDDTSETPADVRYSHGRMDYSIYEGCHFRGKIKAVIKGGDLAFVDGVVNENLKKGKLIE